MSKVRVCYPYNGNIVGGSHVSSIGMIKQLDPSRFEPLILVRYPDGPIGDYLREQGVAFEPMPITGTISYRSENDPRIKALVTVLETAWVNLRSILPLRRLLEERAVDIVHTNDGASHVTWALAAAIASTKFIWHHRSPPSARGIRYMGWLADRILTVSDYAIPNKIHFAGRDRVEVAYSPFDLDGMNIDRAACRKEVLEQVKAATTARIIGYSGNFVVRKQPLAFVQAVAAVKRQRPDLEFVAPMFGADVEVSNAEIAALAAELDVADEVRTMGFCRGGDRLIAGCDVLAVPAITEPFGRTLIESMIVGTPVVAARSGGNIEALDDGKTGFLVTPGDHEGMARHIVDLLTDQELRTSIVDAAQRDVASRFGLRRHADQIMRVYDDLMTLPIDPTLQLEGVQAPRSHR